MITLARCGNGPFYPSAAHIRTIDFCTRTLTGYDNRHGISVGILSGAYFIKKVVTIS